MNRKIFAVILTFALLLGLCPLSVWAVEAAAVESENAEDMDWMDDTEERSTVKGEWITVNGIEGGQIRFDSSTGTITSCENTVTVANIPATINGVSVTSIQDGAFYNCTRLTNITIPNCVTSIGERVFNSCKNLASITIPDRVTSIQDGAFYDCTSLKDVYYTGTESQWKAISIVTGDNYPQGHGPIFLGNDCLLNATIHYNSPDPTEINATTDPSNDPAPSATPIVQVSPQNLTVDGKAIACEKYNIDGANYFKLRDLASLLNDTGSQFSVGYDAATNTVTITKGEAYTAIGGELEVGVDQSATAVVSEQTILIDGESVSNLSVYNLGGNNYFKLRDLGEALGFGVDYDEATNTAVVTSAVSTANEDVEVEE